MSTHDEIEFFKEGKSLYKTCLPQGSTATLRKAIADHGGVIDPDRFVIISNGKIRVDSDKMLVLKKELGITALLYKGERIWTRKKTEGGRLIVINIETKQEVDSEECSRDYAFYKKYHDENPPT